MWNQLRSESIHLHALNQPINMLERERDWKWSFRCKSLMLVPRLCWLLVVKKRCFGSAGDGYPAIAALRTNGKAATVSRAGVKRATLSAVFSQAAKSHSSVLAARLAYLSRIRNENENRRGLAAHKNYQQIKMSETELHQSAFGR